MLQRRLLWQRRLRAPAGFWPRQLPGRSCWEWLTTCLRFKDPGLRIMATSAWLVFIGYVVYRTWYLPGRVPLQPLDVARQLENHFPQLHDSVASAIEFLQQSEHESAAGSPQLRRLVIAEAQNNVESLPITEIASFRSSLRSVLPCSRTLAVSRVPLHQSQCRRNGHRPFGPTTWHDDLAAATSFGIPRRTQTTGCRADAGSRTH